VRSLLPIPFVIPVVVAAAGVCAPGCARRAAETQTPTVTLRIGVGGGGESGTRGVINLLKGDPWLSSRPDGRPADRIATSWSFDEAGTTLRLKLRSDVVFHDGTRLTPDVAVRAMRATVASGANLALRAPNISSIDTDGSDGIAIHLTGRNSFILADLMGALVVKADNPDIGTGPFKVDRRDGKNARLSAFPSYYRGQPKLAGVDVSAYLTQRSAWSALMRNEVDMLYEVSRDAAGFVQAETTVNTYSFPRPYYIPLVFNVRRPVFKDPRVRQAINMALDRELLVRDGMGGRGSVADGPVWPQHWAYAAPKQPFVYDPAASRNLLDQAGYGVRPNQGNGIPARFSFKCVVFANDSRFDRIEVLIQKQLADVGIEMVLVPVALDQFNDRVRVGDFDAFVIEMAGRSLSWVYEFWHTNPRGQLDSGYRSADAVLDRVKGARSDDEVRSAIADFAQVLHDDPPAAFLTWQQQSRAVSRKFDVAAEEKRDILTNLWQWRPAGAK
jgi:ABC-type transport system substrate-binding protein